MKKDYWITFWKEYGEKYNDKDAHSQVLRTLNKKPISIELWEFTLKNIDEVFPIQTKETVLDLCAGNGLLSRHFVKKGASVVAVDVSKDLLEAIIETEEIQTIHSDIRDLHFENNSFDKIIIYAGIQYLNHKEAIVLLKNIYNWLKPGGIVFIGDIPDKSKLWDFYNTEERQKAYFNNVLNEVSIVGYWFDNSWFENLTTFLGFKEGTYLAQHEQLIYSNFRFDFLYKKDD